MREKLLDRESLFAWLRNAGMHDWAEELAGICSTRFSTEAHGTMVDWISAWHSLPGPAQCELSLNGGTVAVTGSTQSNFDSQELRKTLMRFHPWRKGPFQFLDLAIETEWRSDWKWERLSQEIEFQGKTILDVGCGNGYYGWRMLDAGAAFVLGCDPFLLYAMQFEVLRRYAAAPEQHFLVPIADDELPRTNFFDMTLSMGVLYHRTSPIDHLKTLWHTLKPGGELVLETLIIDANESKVLVPQGRYAKMRNVWFIPSLSMLELWLTRTGFTNVRVLDISVTTPDEQRRTEWMTFESLADFLDPNDSRKTIEGYPAPIRAVLTATKRK